MNERLLSSIKALPPLPESVRQLQLAFRDEDVSVARIASILETDPMLTANVLKTANSPFYGFTSQITTIKHAVTLLGPAVIRGFALANSLRAHLPLDMSPYGISNQAFARLATMQQALATRWLTREQPEELGVLMPASFIMGLGKLVVAQAVLGSDQADQFRQAIAECSDPGAVETAYVGSNSHSVSAAMFRRWRLEPDLVDAIEAMPSPAAADDPTRSRAHVLAAVEASVNVLGVLTDAQLKRGRWLAASGGRDPRIFDQAVAELQSTEEPVFTHE